jgi:hypothetical protein
MKFIFIFYLFVASYSICFSQLEENEVILFQIKTFSIDPPIIADDYLYFVSLPKSNLDSFETFGSLDSKHFDFICQVTSNDGHLISGTADSDHIFYCCEFGGHRNYLDSIQYNNFDSLYISKHNDKRINTYTTIPPSVDSIFTDSSITKLSFEVTYVGHDGDIYRTIHEISFVEAKIKYCTGRPIFTKLSYEYRYEIYDTYIAELINKNKVDENTFKKIHFLLDSIF